MTRKSKLMSPNPLCRERTQSAVARHRRACNGKSPTDSGSPQRILESASTLFERKGYASTSVREIAAAASIAKPAIYYHFGSKEGLYSALLEDCVAKVDQVLAEVSGVEATPWERIESLCHGLILLMRRNAFAMRLFVTAQFGPLQEGSLCGCVQSWTKIETALWKFLAQGRREGSFQFEQVEDALVLVTGIVLVSSSGGQRCPGQSLVQKALSRALKLALRGISSSTKEDLPNPPKMPAEQNNRGRRTALARRRSERP